MITGCCFAAANERRGATHTYMTEHVTLVIEGLPIHLVLPNSDASVFCMCACTWRGTGNIINCLTPRAIHWSDLINKVGYVRERE
jgi:hypothetical protein